MQLNEQETNGKERSMKIEMLRSHKYTVRLQVKHVTSSYSQPNRMLKWVAAVMCTLGSNDAVEKSRPLRKRDQLELFVLGSLLECS